MAVKSECCRFLASEKILSKDPEGASYYLFILMWIIFKVIIEFVTILLLFCFSFLGHKACGILAPRPGIRPAHTALEGEVLITGLPGKSPGCFCLFFFFLSRALELTQVSQVVQPADVLPTLSFKDDGKCWSCCEGEGLIVGVWVVFEGEGCLCRC